MPLTSNEMYTTLAQTFSTVKNHYKKKLMLGKCDPCTFSYNIKSIAYAIKNVYKSRHCHVITTFLCERVWGGAACNPIPVYMYSDAIIPNRLSVIL